MKKQINVKQHDITDCGAACLSSISSYYDKLIPISKIRQYASTDKRGTNLLGLIEASEKLGFIAKGVRGDESSLSKIPLPAVAHVILENQLHHYVVIYKVTDSHVTVMDPAYGKQEDITKDEFLKIWSGVLMLILPDEGFKVENLKVSNYKRFSYLLKPHKLVTFQAIIGALIVTVLGLSTSVFVEKIVDYVIVGGNKKLLNLMGVVMIGLLIFQILLNYSKSIIIQKVGQRIDAQLLVGYYKHLIRLPQSFFDNMRVGEILSRINDAVKIRVFINEVAINIVVNVFMILFAFVLMFTYYWKLAIIMMLIIPLYTLIYFITNKVNKKAQRILMQDSANLESQLVESVTNVSTIKRFGVEDYVNNKTEEIFIKLLRSVYKTGVNSIASSSATEFVSKLFTIILLWVGSLYVIDQTITPGELMSFYSIIGYFTSPAAVLINSNRTIQDALIASDRLFEIMDLDQEAEGTKIDLTPENIGNIVFKDVAFRYGSRNDVFEKLNIKIEKSKITAIVGESGCGKSTLISLLQNIYPLTSGSIQIGEFNLEHINNNSLRKNVGIVPQKLDLFSGNIIDNIALGDYNPNLEKIVKICKDLDILSFIESLPNGFETYVGENGYSLSGGQRQRIAIARALYSEPEIFIFDEATSSLDSKSETFVQNCIYNLKEQGKTIIIIAHRLSTIKNADKILVLNKGELVEEGNHQQLIDKNGYYSNYWSQQLIA